MSFFRHLSSRSLKHFSNLPGWTTSRRIVVFESDDWGSIRMPSLSIIDDLEGKGLDLTSGGASRYNFNDTLADEEDLTGLFDVLSSFVDSAGNPCVFTAVCVVANPDFEKIASANFSEYFFEPFTTTLERYFGHTRSFDLWKVGMREKIFIPQFHGREHLNVSAWLAALSSGDVNTRLAFDYGVWAFRNQPVNGVNLSYQAAFDLVSMDDLRYQKEVIVSGLDLFEDLFGYRATFFVPPNGPINNLLEETAALNGIRFMSTSKIQHEALGRGKTRKRFHYLGQKNKVNQTYLTRNCLFEPGQAGTNWVSSCLDDIAVAFKWNKPAVISTHRVNYIGGLNHRNRTNGLSQLRSLLSEILKRWPEVEFMESSRLGFLIEEKK